MRSQHMYTLDGWLPSHGRAGSALYSITVSRGFETTMYLRLCESFTYQAVGLISQDNHEGFAGRRYEIYHLLNILNLV